MDAGVETRRRIRTGRKEEEKRGEKERQRAERRERNYKRERRGEPWSTYFIDNDSLPSSRLTCKTMEDRRDGSGKAGAEKKGDRGIEDDVDPKRESDTHTVRGSGLA
jgi:hypothetical protein